MYFCKLQIISNVPLSKLYSLALQSILGKIRQKLVPQIFPKVSNPQKSKFLKDSFFQNAMPKNFLQHAFIGRSGETEEAF